MTHKFKVGDRVRVSVTDKDSENWDIRAKVLVGKIVTISSLRYLDSYYIEEDNHKYGWSEHELTPIVDWKQRLNYET